MAAGEPVKNEIVSDKPSGPSLKVNDEVSSSSVLSPGGTAESSKSGASRGSNGSDKRSSGGRSSESEQRRRRRSSQGSGGSNNNNNESCLSNDSKKLANVEEVKKEESICDTNSGLRLVNNQVLLDMAKGIKPPPNDPTPDLKGGIKSPKGKGKPTKAKDAVPYGPMPNFEREIQKIIAEQELVTKRTAYQDSQLDSTTSDVPFKSSPSSLDPSNSNVSPTRRKEELHEKLALLNSRSRGSAKGKDSEYENETDDGGLDHLSMAANGGLTDAEGAMSDVNSMYECGDIGDGPEMDDTSLSSRASSRIFDSDQIYSAESMHGMYDSEYDNYRGGHMTSDAESDFPNEDLDSDVGAVLDELSLENIRQISKNITRKFGARSDREDEDSDAV